MTTQITDWTKKSGDKVPHLSGDAWLMTMSWHTEIPYWYVWDENFSSSIGPRTRSKVKVTCKIAVNSHMYLHNNSYGRFSSTLL